MARTQARLSDVAARGARLPPTARRGAITPAAEQEVNGVAVVVVAVVVNGSVQALP